jgi:hypothetical protein
MLLRENFTRMLKDPAYRHDELKKDRRINILKLDMNNYSNLDEDYPDLIDCALEEFYREMN